MRLVVVAALALAPIAAAATPAQIAADLSHQRVANGIPGGIQLERAGRAAARTTSVTTS
jgi:hypothetical protein